MIVHSGLKNRGPPTVTASQILKRGPSDFFAVVSSAIVTNAAPSLKRQLVAAFMIPSGRTGASLSMNFLEIDFLIHTSFSRPKTGIARALIISADSAAFS